MSDGTERTLAETQTAGFGLANGRVIDELTLALDEDRPAIQVRHDRADYPDPMEKREVRKTVVETVTVLPTSDIDRRKVEIGTGHGRDRVIIETHDHAPRAYVRHERDDGGWTEVAAWELHSATGLTQVSGEVVADGGTDVDDTEHTECEVCGYEPDADRVPPHYVLSLSDEDSDDEYVQSYPFGGSLPMPFACSDECWLDAQNDPELVTDGGLYEKYDVRKDGEPVRDCFVLEPELDSAAREALIRYAEATDDDQLAEDLREWVIEICTRGSETGERYAYSEVTNTWYRVTEWDGLGDGKIQAKEKEPVDRDEVPQDVLEATDE